jgi:hypothetical protein
LPPFSRPAGISLIAAFLGFAGLLCLMLAPLGRVLALDLATGLSPAVLLAVFALNGLLYLLTAWGLWTLRSWARLLGLVIAFLGMAPSLVWLARWLLAGGPPDPSSTVLARLLLLALWAFVLGYLNQAHVRQVFRTPHS